MHQPVRRQGSATGSGCPGPPNEAGVALTERRGSLLDRIRARRWLRTALAAAVPVGFVSVLLFIPYVLLLVQSFWRLQGGAIIHELTLDNYRRLFGTPLYPNTILFSAGIALRVTVFSLLLAYPLAYLLAFKVKRHRNLMYMAVIIPLWVSYLVRAYAWKIILGQEGILNGLLQSAGLIDQPLTFLLYSRWAVILALTHIYTPFTLMPIYAVLEAIPPALKEASQDLYAGRWQTFWRVVLPLSLPGVIAGSTFAFVLSMGDFLAPQLLGGNDSALMVSNLVWSLFGVAYNWPLGAAVSVVVLALTLFLLSMASRVERAMNYGGQAVGQAGGRVVGMGGDKK
jgi:spermidine/putrescine transport system permease protein